MKKTRNLCAALLSVVLLDVYGHPTTEDTNLKVGQVPSGQGAATAMNASLWYNPTSAPFDPPFAGAAYGPEVGLKHDEITSHPKYFDDTRYLQYDSSTHRELRQISCYHKDGQLVGFESLYTISDGSEGLWTHYHGYDPPGLESKTRELHVLAYHDYWSTIQYKICGRKIIGIRFNTHLGSSVFCGPYEKVKGDNCDAGELKPTWNRKIIGLYGDSNGRFLTPRKGIRGIGVTTFWANERQHGPKATTQ